MAHHSTFFRYEHHPSRSLWVFLLPLVVLLIGVGLWYTGYLNTFLVKITPQQIPERQEKKEVNLPIPSPYPYPVNKTGIYPNGSVSAESVVILDVPSHVYLYKRNETLQLFPASTTKLMTALVALDAYNLDDIVDVEIDGAAGQIIGLTKGEKMTVENLLYGALIHSGNDAALALAYHYPGGMPAFVVKMNEKAASLLMDQSHFTNPTGYDDSEQKMTAMDLSRLSLAAISNKTIAKMVAIPQISISDVTHTTFHKLTNVNQLLGKIPGVAGIKTGWTEAAGENLVTYVERNGRKIVFVVLHSRDRFGDTTALIDWVFKNYEWQDMTPSPSMGVQPQERTP